MPRGPNPTGTRWNTLQELVTYATNQWANVEARLAKKKASQPVKVVGGKRKSTGGSLGKRAKLGVLLTAEQLEHNMKNRLCHKCDKPNHIARDCPDSAGSDKPSKKRGKTSNKSKEKSSEDF